MNRFKAHIGYAVAAVVVVLTLGGPALAGPAVARIEDKKPDALAEAREDLRISRLTLERIQRKFDELRRAPSVDPATLADYAIYLDKVRALTAAHRKVVETMEGLQRPTPLAPSIAPDPIGPAVFDPPVPLVEDELTRLDRELMASLARFDAFLLDEQYEAQRRMEQVEAASSAEMNDLAREAAAAVERLRQKGIDVETRTPPGETGEASGSGEPGEADEAGAAGPGTEPGEPGSESAPTGGTGSGSSGTGEQTGDQTGEQTGAQTGGQPGGADGDPATGPVPPGDRPPAADDDIVARQLREAAERETDPVLKEKLWREYDKYKGGG